jgi:hypothetical protein
MHDTCTSTLTLCSRTCSSSRTARAASPRRASLPTSPGWPPRLAGRCWRSTSTPQGNLARDLGYLDRSDGRQGLLAAVLLDQEHSVLEAVRPLGTARGTGCSDAGRLDVVAGKPRVARLSDQLGIEVARFGPAGYGRLSKVIGALAPAHDLVLCDLPPGDGATKAALVHMAGKHGRELRPIDPSNRRWSARSALREPSTAWTSRNGPLPAKRARSFFQDTRMPRPSWSSGPVSSLLALRV